MAKTKYPKVCCPTSMDYEDPEGAIERPELVAGIPFSEKMGHNVAGIVSAKLGVDKYGEPYRDRDGNDAGPVF